MTRLQATHTIIGAACALAAAARVRVAENFTHVHMAGRVLAAIEEGGDG